MIYNVSGQENAINSPSSHAVQQCNSYKQGLHIVPVLRVKEDWRETSENTGTEKMMSQKEVNGIF